MGVPKLIIFLLIGVLWSICEVIACTLHCLAIINRHCRIWQFYIFFFKGAMSMYEFADGLYAHIF